jgi:hypothetical protein
LAHHRSDAKLAAFAAVPDIIRHGKLVFEQPTPRKPGVTSYFLAAPIHIDGEAYVGIALVNRGPDRQGLWVHEVGAIKNLRDFTSPGTPDKSESEPEAKPGDIKSIVLKIFSVKESDQ